MSTHFAFMGQNYELLFVSAILGVVSRMTSGKKVFGLSRYLNGCLGSFDYNHRKSPYLIGGSCNNQNTLYN